MDRFAEVEVFVRIVETGGIGAAARRMGIAKSVVSRRLRDLEDRLGGRLINRTTRQFALTETGRAYFERVSRVLEDLQEADQTAGSDARTLAGTLRIAAPMTFGTMHLAPLVNEFLEQHTALRVDLDLNDRHVDLVEEGFDVAIRIGRLEDSSLIARKLATLCSALVASPGFLARHGEPRSAEDLNTLPGLFYTGVPERKAFACVTPAGATVTPLPVLRARANNGEILARMTEEGLGVSVGPTFISGEAIQSGRLKVLLADHTFPEVTAYAVYPPGRHLSTKVRTFIDFLVERLKQQPWDICLRDLVEASA